MTSKPNHIAKAQSTYFRRWLSFCPSLETPRSRKSCCITVEDPPKRPDPGLYSQRERLGGGLAVSWDSPDITTNLGGNIDENVMVTVRNYSADSPAIGVLVNLDYSEFGIGFPRNSLGSHSVNLRRAGSGGDEESIPFFVPNSIRDAFERVAVFVTVSHSHDRNANNNSGEQAWSASNGQAGASLAFSFRLRNSMQERTTFSLQLLYSDEPGALTPSSIALNPGEVANITLNVAMPAGASGSKRFNIVAFTPDGQLYGGIFHRFDLVGP